MTDAMKAVLSGEITVKENEDICREATKQLQKFAMSLRTAETKLRAELRDKEEREDLSQRSRAKRGKKRTGGDRRTPARWLRLHS